MAERLGFTVDYLLHSMRSDEISEWMAFDNLKDEDYRKKIEGLNMTQDQRNSEILKMFGAK